MNKPQLIVAWVMGGLISLIVVAFPRIAYFPTSNGNYLKVNAKSMEKLIPQINWNSVIQYSIPILIIGGLLIYTLRDKKK